MKKLLFLGFLAGLVAAARWYLSQPVAKPAQDSSGSAASNSAARNGHSPTKDELYKRATQLGIKGRSKMTKAQLERALERAG